MKINDIIVIVIWIVVICIILALLLFTKLAKKKKPVEDSYSKKQQFKSAEYKTIKEEPKPEEKEKDAFKSPKEQKVEEPIEDLDEQDNDFQEEDEEEKEVQVVNGKKVFVQYNYSFKAKLILASKEVQEQYQDIHDFLSQFSVKTSISWKQERIYLGRNTYAMLVFKGKKLCVAYAFDPKRFENTKYHVIDLTEVKRFAKTSTLMKITSDRKQKYVLELLEMIFKENSLDPKDILKEKIVFPKLTKEELIAENLIKVYTSDQITEGTIVEQAKVGDIIRKNVSITEAKQLITDDSALEYVEVEENASNKVYSKKEIINIDVLSKNFAADDLINIDILKEKKLISSKVDYIKVLARGTLDKPLIIEAQDYSIDAIKMIIVTGGEVRKVK